MRRVVRQAVVASRLTTAAAAAVAEPSTLLNIMNSSSDNNNNNSATVVAAVAADRHSSHRAQGNNNYQHNHCLRRTHHDETTVASASASASSSPFPQRQRLLALQRRCHTTNTSTTSTTSTHVDDEVKAPAEKNDDESETVLVVEEEDGDVREARGDNKTNPSANKEDEGQGEDESSSAATGRIRREDQHEETATTKEKEEEETTQTAREDENRDEGESSSSSTVWSSTTTYEAIHPDMVVWEELAIHNTSTSFFSASSTTGTGNAYSKSGAAASSSSSSSDAAGNNKASNSSSSGANYEDVAAVDGFSRGRISNYIRRFQPNISAVTFNTTREGKGSNDNRGDHSSNSNSTSGGSSGGVAIFRARLRIPLPSPHSSYISEGIAETEKDAEALASMHAERVIDALGVPLYRLPSMQTKHAEAARQAGRWAPLPGDPVKPEGTPVPPPMRMVVATMTTGDGAPAGAPTTGSGSSDMKTSSSSSHFEEHFSFGGVVREAEIIETSSTSSMNSTSNNRGNVSSVFSFTTTTTTTSSSSTEAGSTSAVSTTSTTTTSSRRMTVTPTATGAPEQPLSVNSTTTPPPLPAAAAADNKADSSSSGETATTTTTGVTSASAPAAQPNLEGSPVSSSTSMLHDKLHETFHYPWRDGVNVDEHVDPDASPEQVHQREQALYQQQLKANASRMGFGNTAAAANKFDPTENSTFQMTNILSQRFSPSEDSIQLAAMYDKNSFDRIKEWLQVTQGVFNLQSRCSAAQVQVAGYASRMYIVDLRLFPENDPQGNGGIAVARGKAVEKDVATVLACMHAELLLDWAGRPLFPNNPARQSKHAKEVRGYGRWAMDPYATSSSSSATTPDGTGTSNSNNSAEVQPQEPIPLPLKQQLGVEESFLDPAVSRSLRTAEERILAAHGEINATVYDFVEVHPEPEMLAEARLLLQNWFREVAKSRIYELFICTRMGDFIRASCVLPVPAQFGTRGGNAVGRTVEQATSLCALHCIDVLCSLNIPVCLREEEQQALMQKRHQLGLRTTHPDNLLLSNNNSTNTNTNNSKRVFVPYLPGYLIEGDKPRPLPPVNDLGHILHASKRHEDIFQLPLHQSTDKDILDMGNDARMNVQMYTKRTVGKELVPSVYITGFAKGSSVYNIAFMPIMVEAALCPVDVESTPAPPLSSSYLTTAAAPSSSSSSSASSCSSSSSNGRNDNSATATATTKKPLHSAATANNKSQQQQSKSQPFTNPGEAIPGHRRFLAVGASLKKADAIRCCFLHAAEILRTCGIEHTLEKNLFVMAKKANKQLQQQASAPIAKRVRLQPLSGAAAAATAPSSTLNINSKVGPAGAATSPLKTASSEKLTTTATTGSTTPTSPPVTSTAGDDKKSVSSTSSDDQSQYHHQQQQQQTPQLPRPFMHPVMRAFFHNMKLERNAMRRQMSRNAVLK